MIMAKLVDITGIKFGAWTVLGLDRNHRFNCGEAVAHWICRCDCGKSKVVNGKNLKSGISTNCGCQRHRNTSHGMSETSEYSMWQTIRQRCRNSRNKQYANYGGRGIGICDEWHDSFEAFITYIGQRPSHDYSLDRTDNNKGYEPGNVRWATRKEQVNNRRLKRIENFSTIELTAELCKRGYLVTEGTGITLPLY